MRPISILCAGLALLAGVWSLVGQPLEAAAQESAAPTSVSVDERRLYALNLYHEARSQGREGMIAVGWVVLNRIADPDYPDTIAEVINQRRGRNCEWGWTCDGRSDEPGEAEMWQLAQEIADLMLGASRPADPTGGAIWFHETFRSQPGWMGDHVRRSATLGDHHFYARN